MTLIFVKEIVIASGDDGFLYIFNEQRVVKKQNGHPNTPVMCLHSNPNYNMFVSGGMDCKVIIWKLETTQSSFILEKIYEYHLYS